MPARAAARQYEEFVFWVREPSASYSVHLRADIQRDDLIAEHQSLSVVADCIWPARFKGRVASGEVIGCPEISMAASEAPASRLGALV
jgi:hypothetical protein